MLFSTVTILASFFASMAIASPVQAEAIANPFQLEAREDWGKIISFSGDLCNGVSTTVEILGSGAFRCVAIGGGSVQDIEKRYVYSPIPEGYKTVANTVEGLHHKDLERV